MEGILIEITPVVGIALEVLAGKWGNGEERVKKLQSAGYDAERVQRCVNDLLEIIKRYK